MLLKEVTAAVKSELHSHVRKRPLCDYFKPLGSLHTAHLIFPTSAVVCCPHTPNSFIWLQSLGHFETDILYSSFIPHVTHGLPSVYLSTNTAIIIIKDEINISPNYVLFPIPLLLHVCQVM